MSLPHTRLSCWSRLFFGRIATGMSWVWPLLMLVIVVNVVLRYVFGEGRIEFEEIQWHLYSVGFLIGMATCLDNDGHVRVDVLHHRLDDRWRAWIELYGMLLLFLPFVVMLLVFALPFVNYAWISGEVSSAPGGLPFRWLIKGVLPLSMVLLGLAGLARLSRLFCELFGWPAAAMVPSETPRPHDR